MTETEPIPNPILGYSERAAGKSKKREGFSKPNTEPPPNRISESAFSGFEMSWMSCVADPASNSSRTALPNDGVERDRQEVIAFGQPGKLCANYEKLI